MRGAGRTFGPAGLLDGKAETYWATPDDVLTPSVTLQFRQPVTFNVVELREYLPLGQRLEAFAVDRWQEGEWVECARGTSVGNRRLLRLGTPVQTERVRLRVTQASACPALSAFGLYLEPVQE
ncbi:MAG: discoidin domain-containing protein [Verrucomicrobia bacterium]|nr:discoidin domain-containing protein [Verrucomicrobiota bacterium]